MITLGVKLPRAHKRLNCIFEQVTKLANCDDVITDVGTDHGYLPVLLAKTCNFKHIIATDISEKSLVKAKNLAEKYNVAVDCRVCDGLEKAPETTFAVMCGIGGNEIIKILQNSQFCGKMVLQPVPTADDLRKYLLENNYHIAKDFCIYDENKFYFVFVVDGFGKNKYSKLDKLFGKTNVKEMTKDFCLYLENQIKKLKFLENFDITNISKISKKDIKHKQEYLRYARQLLGEVKQ